MRALVQRVRGARVTVEGEPVGAIATGLLVFVGAEADDTLDDASFIERKVTSLRIFQDADGKMNLSVKDVGGSLLVVSQFTLCADIGKGARPSFMGAMAPAAARPLIEAMVARLRNEIPVETGRFGADMQVELTNDGPVTLWLDSRRRERT